MSTNKNTTRVKKIKTALFIRENNCTLQNSFANFCNYHLRRSAF